MYPSTKQLSKASIINANDTARTITALVMQIKVFELEFIVNDERTITTIFKYVEKFDFEFIVNYDFYIPWF